jgi:hypothetical protein
MGAVVLRNGGGGRRGAESERKPPLSGWGEAFGFIALLNPTFLTITNWMLEFHYHNKTIPKE